MDPLQINPIKNIVHVRSNIITKRQQDIYRLKHPCKVHTQYTSTTPNVTMIGRTSMHSTI